MHVDGFRTSGIFREVEFGLGKAENGMSCGGGSEFVPVGWRTMEEWIVYGVLCSLDERGGWVRVGCVTVDMFKDGDVFLSSVFAPWTLLLYTKIATSCREDQLYFASCSSINFFMPSVVRSPSKSTISSLSAGKNLIVGNP